MGQTARLEVPYPDGGDAVMDGDDAIQAQAEKVETYLPYAGDLKASMQLADHGTWLLCDGRNNVPRASVSADFVATMLAAGFPGADGTKIGVPDFRGRAIVGKGTHGDIDALTDNDGEAVGNRRPKHKHSVADPGLGEAYHSGVPTGLFLRTSIEGDARHIGIDGHVTVGPQASSPTDGPAYQVSNVFVFAGTP